MSRERVTPRVDLSHLPEFVTTPMLRELGFTDTGIRHLKRACGRVYRVGRYVYVHRSDLERAIAAQEVKVS